MIKWREEGVRSIFFFTNGVDALGKWMRNPLFRFIAAGMKNMFEYGEEDVGGDGGSGGVCWRLDVAEGGLLSALCE